MATDTASLTKDLLAQNITIFTVDTQHTQLSVRLGIETSPTGPVCKAKELVPSAHMDSNTPNWRSWFTIEV